MSIFSNLIVLFLGIIWFHIILKANKKSKIGVIIPVYFLATVLVYAVVFALSHEYLDGVLHAVCGLGSIFLFWLWTTIALTIFNIRQNNRQDIFKDFLRTSPLLLIPLFMWLWLRTGSFKIGG